MEFVSIQLYASQYVFPLTKAYTWVLMLYKVPFLLKLEQPAQGLFSVSCSSYRFSQNQKMF